MLADQDSLKELILGDTGEPAFMFSGWNYLDLVVLMVGFVLKFGDPNGPLKDLTLARRPFTGPEPALAVISTHDQSDNIGKGVCSQEVIHPLRPYP